MNKKIIILFLALLSITISLSGLNATDFEDVTVDNNTMTIHNIKFNIPDGYTIDKSEKANGSTSCTLYDKDSNSIYVSVYYEGDYSNFVSNLKDNEKKTIKNHEGKYEKTSDTYSFEYVENDCHIIIIGNPNDEELIEKMIN